MQYKIVNLLKTLWDFFVITCYSVFNAWPKTTLLPVWPRDAKGGTPLTLEHGKQTDKSRQRGKKRRRTYFGKLNLDHKIRSFAGAQRKAQEKQTPLLSVIYCWITNHSKIYKLKTMIYYFSWSFWLLVNCSADFLRALSVSYSSGLQPFPSHGTHKLITKILRHTRKYIFCWSDKRK